MMKCHDKLHYNMKSPHTLIMASLSALSPSHLSRLTHSIDALLRRRLRRLAAVLSSPALFILTLHRLQSLSLHRKSLLIARHLFSTLTLLKHLIQSDDVSTQLQQAPLTKLRDLDSALLLLLLCEVDRHDRDLLDTPPSRWRVALRDYVSDLLFRVSSLGGFCPETILLQFVESVGRCWNLVDVMCCDGGEAASAAAVVALPSVEVTGGRECAICREEMREGREVCELPCRHLFHWGCILPWLGTRNTCPCCRRRLPTDDVRREIERLLDDLAEIGGGGGGGFIC